MNEATNTVRNDSTVALQVRSNSQSDWMRLSPGVTGPIPVQDTRLTVRRVGRSQSTIVQLSELQRNDQGLYLLTLDSLGGAGYNTLTMINATPMRLGYSVNGGPTVIPESATLAVVLPASSTSVEVVIAFGNNQYSVPLSLTVEADTSLRVVVPNERSTAQGELIEPGDIYARGLYAFHLGRLGRLSFEVLRGQSSANQYTYVLAENAPALPFSLSNIPAYWSYDGSVAVPVSTTPSGTVVSRPTPNRTITNPAAPPPPVDSRNWLAIIILGLLGLMLVATVIAALYLAYRRSSTTGATTSGDQLLTDDDLLDIY